MIHPPPVDFPRFSTRLTSVTLSSRGACDLRPVHREQAPKRQGDEWHKARTLAGRIPSFTTGAYLAFIAVGTREFTTADPSLLQGKLRCNGCHGRWPVFGVLWTPIHRERRARQSWLSSHGSSATRYSNSTEELHGLSKKRDIRGRRRGNGMGLSRSLAFEFEWVSSCNGDWDFGVYADEVTTVDDGWIMGWRSANEGGEKDGLYLRIMEEL